MKCSDCNEEANTRVRVNGKPSVVCEAHRVAIVKRIEQVTRLFGRSNPNLQKMLLMALGEIEFEDLPIELPPSSVLGLPPGPASARK